MTRSLRAVAAAAMCMACLVVAEAQAQIDGLWLYRQLGDPQAGARLDMSYQTAPPEGQTLAVICDSQSRLLLAIVPRPPGSVDRVAYRIDGADWTQEAWRPEEKRLVLEGEAAKRAVGRIMFADRVELRVGDGEPVVFFGAGLVESLTRQEGRCIKPS